MSGLTVFSRTLKHVPALFLPAPHTVLGAPLEVIRRMEQRGGTDRGGSESPSLQDSASSDERGDRGESPVSIGPPQSKMSRAEVNGSPANPRARQSSTPLRPLGGGPLRHTRKLEYRDTHAFLVFEVYL